MKIKLKSNKKNSDFKRSNFETDLESNIMKRITSSNFSIPPLPNLKDNDLHLSNFENVNENEDKNKLLIPFENFNSFVNKENENEIEIENEPQYYTFEAQENNSGINVIDADYKIFDEGKNEGNLFTGVKGLFKKKQTFDLFASPNTALKAEPELLSINEPHFGNNSRLESYRLDSVNRIVKGPAPLPDFSDDEEIHEANYKENENYARVDERGEVSNAPIHRADNYNWPDNFQKGGKQILVNEVDSHCQINSQKKDSRKEIFKNQFNRNNNNDYLQVKGKIKRKKIQKTVTGKSSDTSKREKFKINENKTKVEKYFDNDKQKYKNYQMQQNIYKRDQEIKEKAAKMREYEYRFVNGMKRATPAKQKKIEELPFKQNRISMIKESIVDSFKYENKEKIGLSEFCEILTSSFSNNTPKLKNKNIEETSENASISGTTQIALDSFFKVFTLALNFILVITSKDKLNNCMVSVNTAKEFHKNVDFWMKSLPFCGFLQLPLYTLSLVLPQTSGQEKLRMLNDMDEENGLLGRNKKHNFIAGKDKYKEFQDEDKSLKATFVVTIDCLLIIGVITIGYKTFSYLYWTFSVLSKIFSFFKLI
ncbi:hypothetical protein DAMA08_023510 [Martiniozyma asiatica (nom. inval.)]|nr:hypothetical protein DAMA08_023510 [Martiniozyma asiatica]